MPLIIWTDDLSVHIASIDRQHQELIRMINELNDAMKVGKANNVLSGIINGLLAYTRTHFSMEERLFDQYHYPDTALHKVQHEKFVHEVEQFRNDFDQGKLGMSIKIISFLKDWLLNHIKGTDQKYSSLFIEKGVV